MGSFGLASGSSKSQFESEMGETARQLVLSLGKVQEGMRICLLKHLSANSLGVDNEAIENTFTWLISAVPPPEAQLEVARRYVDILKSFPLAQKAFSTAMAFKINLMTSQGLMSEAMRIVKNLNALRIPVFSLDLRLPGERAFIAMADEFYNGCKDMVVLRDASGGSNILLMGAERYELREELGRGAFGVVHLAFDKKLHREVAIKRLMVARNDARYSEFILRFEREARIIAGLNHPNIVNIFDFNNNDQGYSIVMEYVRGGSLSMLLAESAGRLPLDRGVDLGLQICRGLAHAHNHGVVHRDLKPQNILLQNDGSGYRAKIADFGIARGAVQASSLNTIGGLGTPLYMPPEQRINAREVTATSDIYSFGKVLLEVVTGVVGFEVDVDGTDLPDDLKEVIKKCTQRNPGLRYTDARTLLEDMSVIHTRQGAS